jgi:hypothetical protein
MVFAAVAQQVTGQRIRLIWYYCPLQQELEPTCFNIYHGGGIGQVDYDNPAGLVEYRGRRFYSWCSGELDDGEYQFAIRAEDAKGEEGCPIVLRATVRDDGLTAVSILGVNAV